jgi:hypothetical protein
MGRVEDIRNAAADENVSVPTVLRLCLTYAIDTGDEELKRWANLELGGYPDDDELPAFRVIKTHSKGNYTGVGYLRTNTRVETSGLDEDVRERAHTIRLYTVLMSL